MTQTILCVGHVCLDIINTCSHYPEEDSQVGTTTYNNRCIDQRWQRGGNASNNSSVLGLLGAKVDFFGTVADNKEKGFIVDDFAQYNVGVSNIVFHQNCDSPCSCVIINASNGSRTIIHSNKNLPEVTIEDFKKIDLSQYSWIHFEGRNISQVCEMVKHIRTYNIHKDGYPIKISIEIEKPKEHMEQLMPLGDVVFIAKDYALSKGYTNMEETLLKEAKWAQDEALFICPWGEKGVTARLSNGTFVTSSAFPPSCVVDTLGAGDTFIAATIYYLSTGHSPVDSITFGCKVAGCKVGLIGFTSLKKAVEEL